MEQHSSFTVRDIFHVLFKRKRIIMLVFLSTVATVAVLAVVFYQPVYEATSQFLLRPGREHVFDLTLLTGDAVRPHVSFDLEEQRARTIQLLTGRYLSEQVVRTLGARELCREPPHLPIPFWSQSFCDPALDQQMFFERVVSQVHENVHAERVGDAALVNLSFRHADPVVAAKVVNVLGSLYLDRHLGVLKNPQTEAFLQEQFGVLRERLLQAQNEVEAFKAQNGISSTVKEERGIASQQLTRVQTEHSESLTREAEVRSRVAQFKAQLTNIATNPQAITATRDKLMQLEGKETELAVRLGDRNPTLVGLREEIRRTREQLLRTNDGSLYQRLQEELLRNETELNALRARLLTQGPNVAKLKKQLEKLDRIEPEFDRLEQQAQLEQQNYHLYMTKSQEARISNAMDAEKITSVKVIEPARPPRQPVSSKLELKMLLALIFGAVGGLAMAFGMEIFSDRLETAERVESALEVPVLASLPSLQPE